MKWIIRSTENGTRLSSATVDEKKRDARKKILKAGFHALEYEGQLSFYDPSGNEVREQVTILEPVTGGVYV